MNNTFLQKISQRLEAPFDDEAPEGVLSMNFWTELPTIINLIVTIAFVLVTFMLIWGGIQYVTAGGNDENQKKAKKTLVNAIVGMVVILMSWSVMIGVRSLVEGLENTAA